MKYLTLENYLHSPNQQAGISEERETQMIIECIQFMDGMLAHFKVHPQAQGIAMNIFHFFIKSVPFTDIDRSMLAGVCFFLGCKIDYNHMRLEHVCRYYHENKKGPKKRKPFEDVAEPLNNEFTMIELSCLKLIEFDFNFDLPHNYMRITREKWFFSENV